MQQTKGVGLIKVFLTTCTSSVDRVDYFYYAWLWIPWLQLKPVSQRLLIMNFEIKLFVLIIAMGKVKPNEVSDYQGEITNNNNNGRQLPFTVLINWLPRNSSIFCEPIPRIRVFQKGNCSLEFQIWSTIIYICVTTNSSFGLQSYYIHNLTATSWPVK